MGVKGKTRLTPRFWVCATGKIELLFPEMRVGHMWVEQDWGAIFILHIFIKKKNFFF